MKDLNIENFKNIAEVEELQTAIISDRARAISQRRKIRKLKKEILESEQQQEDIIRDYDSQLARLKELHGQFNSGIVNRSKLS